MEKTLPRQLDAPEKQTMGVALIYSFFCYFSIPFILLLANIGLEYDYRAKSWFETIYHLLNLLVMVSLFREYLSFSWLTVRIGKRQVLLTAAITAAIMIAITVFWQMRYIFNGTYFYSVGASCTLPVTEMDALLVGSGVAMNLPIVGTILLSALTPVVTCCMCYAAVFPAGYNVRPWLGYLLVALLTAFPQFCSGFTHWDVQEAMAIFAVRLPVHMVSCWAYQKTDTIWTPIFAHMGANLFACLMMIFWQ